MPEEHATGGPTMACYRDFSELVLHATKDQDYRLNILDRSADITVTAIHGGGIEPLTSELAAAVAGETHNLYDLQGLRLAGNEELRVPNARFSEMRLQGLLMRSRLAVSIDGVDGAEEVIYLGGRHRRLRTLLAKSLAEAGFVVRRSSSAMPSHDPTLFYNTPQDGGIQIEFTRRMRERMAEGRVPGQGGDEGAPLSELMQRCVSAIRVALERCQLEDRDDLDTAMRRFEKGTQALRSLLQDARRDQQN